MTASRRLLYVSPIMPHVTGGGLSMRSGAVLRMLAERHEVHLLVAPVHGIVDATLPPSLAELCAQVAILPADRRETTPSPFFSSLRVAWPATGSESAQAARRPAFVDVDFSVVHVFRLTAIPYALAYLYGPGTPPRRHLDLDETESASRRRLAELYRATGHEAAAGFAELEAALCADLEREVLRRFDRVYVCSPAERRNLPEVRDGGEVRVLENTLPVPAPFEPKPASDAFRFLFVGTLGFLPNEDAARYFCLDVLPRLRAIAARPIEVSIVGAAPGPVLRALADIPEVRCVGSVPSVTAWYEWADAVVVPLRTGGGTRIKVLEAISHHRPVIATTVGVEGLALRPDEDVLVADDAATFAGQCMRVMREPALAARLAERAFAVFLSRHTPEAVRGVLDD